MVTHPWSRPQLCAAKTCGEQTPPPCITDVVCKYIEIFCNVCALTQNIFYVSRFLCCSAHYWQPAPPVSRCSLRRRIHTEAPGVRNNGSLSPPPVLRAGAGAQSCCAPCCLSLHLGAEGTHKVRSAVGISLCASFPPPRGEAGNGAAAKIPQGIKCNSSSAKGRRAAGRSLRIY